MLNQDGDGHVAVDYSAEGHKNGGLHPRLSLNEEQTDWTYSMRCFLSQLIFKFKMIRFPEKTFNSASLFCPDESMF